MPRLIDADALYKLFGASGNCNDCPLDAYKCQYYNEHTLMEFCERIDDAPTVDAEPVRHGHWINTGFLTAKCSECDAEVHELEYGNYCPNCGAKMDEEEEDGETN